MVYLAPGLALEIEVFECLQAIDADVEVGGVED